jgi:hypothetical protein
MGLPFRITILGNLIAGRSAQGKQLRPIPSGANFYLVKHSMTHFVRKRRPRPDRSRIALEERTVDILTHPDLKRSVNRRSGFRLRIGEFLMTHCVYVDSLALKAVVNQMSNVQGTA